MMIVSSTNICRQCGVAVTGKYCGNCGQPFPSKRLTVTAIMQEIFHFFTHFDHGFPYTIKKLLTAPGYMQKDYIKGARGKYQKPFSMFFLCASIAALMYYWINLAMVRYFDAGSASEVSFFHQYMVILQVVMVPVYALITFLFFRKAGYNYAEVLVQLLYTFSWLLIMVAAIQILKFIWPHLQTRYIELPAILLYSTITSIRFFEGRPWWALIVKSILATSVCFFLAGFAQDILIKYILS